VRFDRETLGPHLRRERERRGVTLDQIAEQTKIKRSLLAALERGDVAAWPGGLYRRAFFRAYVDAIGLDGAALIGEFVRLFPDPEAAQHAVDAPAAAPLRLTLADDAGAAPRRTREKNFLAALVDTLGIVGVGLMVAAFIGHPAATIATAALLYHAVVTIRGGVRADAARSAARPETVPSHAPDASEPATARNVARLRPRPARRPVEPPIVHGAHNAIG